MTKANVLTFRSMAIREEFALEHAFLLEEISAVVCRGYQVRDIDIGELIIAYASGDLSLDEALKVLKELGEG